ncbi:hypothetical protein EDC04DRAFT_2740911 [Pisolithus marmoratus]|nr:hypothetical protein EDC04DRAFT_2740911 [Pisolithus marmoratus]
MVRPCSGRGGQRLGLLAHKSLIQEATDRGSYRLKGASGAGAETKKQKDGVLDMIPEGGDSCAWIYLNRTWKFDRVDYVNAQIEIRKKQSCMYTFQPSCKAQSQTVSSMMSLQAVYPMMITVAPNTQGCRQLIRSKYSQRCEKADLSVIVMGWRWEDSAVLEFFLCNCQTIHGRIAVSQADQGSTNSID